MTQSSAMSTAPSQLGAAITSSSTPTTSTKPASTALARADRSIQHSAPTPAWRRVGTDISSAGSVHEALAMAGLDWDVESRPLTIGSSITGSDRIAVPGHRAIVRADTGEVLGVVGRRYRPIQNEQALAWLDELVGEGVGFETAGLLGGGRLVWMLLRLPGELRIDGTDDISRPYVLVINAHDGTRCLQVLRTAVRLICSNALVAALREASRRTLSVRHTGSSMSRLDEARRVLGLASAELAELHQAMQAMARVRLGQAAARDFFAGLLPPREEAEGPDPTLAALLTAFEDPRQRLPGIAGSLWAAVNAVSQYTDWERPARGATPQQQDQRRLGSIWLGAGASLKAKAWKSARAMLV